MPPRSPGGEAPGGIQQTRAKKLPGDMNLLLHRWILMQGEMSVTSRHKIVFEFGLELPTFAFFWLVALISSCFNLDW